MTKRSVVRSVEAAPAPADLQAAQKAFTRLHSSLEELGERAAEVASALPPKPTPERIAYLVDRANRVQDMMLWEVADLVDDADGRRLQLQNAREAGRVGGKARQGKRYADGDRAKWRALAAKRYSTLNPRAAAIKIADYLAGTLPPGDAPKWRTIYPVLSNDLSWRR